MNKPLLSWSSSLLGIVLLTLSSCNGNTNKPAPAPTQELYPTEWSQIRTEDNTVLKTLNEANAGAKLFEGKPSEWKNVEAKWEKMGDGKYTLTHLIIKENKLSTIKIGGSKEETFPALQSLKIVSESLTKVDIKDQPALTSIDIDGLGKSPLTELSLPDAILPKSENAAVTPLVLKNLRIAGFPQLKKLERKGGQYEKITIEDLPLLLDFAPKNLADSEGTKLDSFTVKELEFGGKMNSLDYVYLTDKGIEKLILTSETAPALQTLTISGNKLSGELSITGYKNLKTLQLTTNNLSSLTVKGCPEITELNISNNPSLATLNLEDLEQAKIVDANETAITTVNLTNKLPLLRKFSAYKAKLSSIVLPTKEQAPAFAELILSENELSTLALPEDNDVLEVLLLNQNKIKTLNLSNTPKIWRVQANNNELTDVIVSEEDNFYEAGSDETEFECRNNHLTLPKLDKIVFAFGFPQDGDPEKANFLYAPQTSSEGIDQAKNAIDVTNHTFPDELPFKVQKEKGSAWEEAKAEEYTKVGNVYTFKGKGVFRIIIDRELPYILNGFTPEKPYVIGNLEVK